MVCSSRLTTALCLAGAERANRAKAIWNAGIVVVCSAGNSGQDGFGSITSPGNSQRVITVGSVSHFNDGDPYNDMVSSYSSRGPTASDHYVKPDLLAPGNKVIAPGDRKDSYFVMSGTSMSAAMVTATVALMLEQEPGLNPDTVKARLMRSATKVDMGSPFSTGAGVLDIAAALAETGYTDNAVSPTAYRYEDHQGDGMIGFEDTAQTWGSSEWANAVLWSDAVMWSDAVPWSDAILWSDPARS